MESSSSTRQETLSPHTFFAQDRFYVVSDSKEVKEIIKRHGGMLVDSIAESTLIILGQHESRIKRLKEWVSKERGSGRQPILKELWVQTCGKENEDVDYDGFMIKISGNDAWLSMQAGSQDIAEDPNPDLKPNQALKESLDEKISIATAVQPRSASPHHTIEPNNQTRTPVPPSSLDIVTVIDNAIKENMENALVDIWAKRGHELRKKEMFVELHRQFPNAPRHFFKHLRRKDRARIDARIEFLCQSLDIARMKVDPGRAITPKSEVEHQQAPDQEDSPEQPASGPPSPTSTDNTARSSEVHTRSVTPPTPVVPKVLYGSKCRFIPEENAWAIALYKHRIQQDPSMNLAKVALELSSKRDSHSINSWKIHLKELCKSEFKRVNTPSSSRESHHQHSLPLSRSPSPPAESPSTSDLEGRQKYHKITEQEVQWMLDLFRHRCALDPSITSQEFSEELARKTCHSEATWKRHVDNHGMDMALIRRDLVEELDELRESSTEIQKDEVTRLIKRHPYRTWELDAMAKHLSFYGPGASGPSIWKDFAAKHTHRTLNAWAQAHANKADYINNKAAKFRRANIRAREQGMGYGHQSSVVPTAVIRIARNSRGGYDLTKRSREADEQLHEERKQKKIKVV